MAIFTEWNEEVLDKLEEWSVYWYFHRDIHPLKNRTIDKDILICLDDDNTLLTTDNPICKVMSAEEFLKQAAKMLGKEYPMKQKLKFGDIVDVWDDDGDGRIGWTFICYTPNGVMVTDKDLSQAEQSHDELTTWVAFYQHAKPANTVKEMTIAEIEEELGYSIKIKE